MNAPFPELPPSDPNRKFEPIDFDSLPIRDEGPDLAASLCRFTCRPQPLVSLLCATALALGAFHVAVSGMNWWMYDATMQWQRGHLHAFLHFETAHRMEKRLESLGTIKWGANVIGATMLLAWVYVSKANVVGFGAQGLGMPPATSVIVFFIPIMNLIAPYLAVSETWRASQDPQSWPTVRNHGFVRCWWMIAIAAVAAAGIVRANRSELFLSPGFILLQAFAELTWGLWWLATAFLVSRIHAYQNAWVAGSPPQDEDPLDLGVDGD